jgi:transposase
VTTIPIPATGRFDLTDAQ